MEESGRYARNNTALHGVFLFLVPAMITPTLPSARLVIRYCTGCRWMMRAAWVAQELLVTFEQELAEVALAPGSGGIFQIWLNDERLWDRKEDGGFPELRVLKQRIRDRVAPDKPLGHSDRPA
jgi:selenoprotein W-related protein